MTFYDKISKTRFFMTFYDFMTEWEACTHLRPWSNESNNSPSSIQYSRSVKCWIRLTTCCTVFGAARCCSMLLDAARCCSMLLDAARCCSVLFGAVLRCLMAIKNVGRAIEHFFCLRFSFDAKLRVLCYVCTNSMGTAQELTKL